ncbi:MAG: glycosyltransferase family 2 protein [Patescibacteria group bacterium]
MKSNQDISVIIPVFNEEKNLPILLRELRSVLDNLKSSYEIVCINDASTDDSLSELIKAAKKNDKIKIIDFARNFGQTAALSAGIALSSGDIIIPIDGDLQNDPKDIPRLLKEISKGYSVVSGWRKKRKDSFLRVLPSQIANWIITRATRVRLHDNGCSLKAYKREIIEGVPLYGEMHRFISVFAAWSGGRVTEIIVNHRPRRFGKSNYGFSRVFKVILDLLVIRFLHSYMSRPVHFFGKYGFCAFAVGSGFEFWAVILKVVDGRSFIATPLPVVGAMFLIVGAQLVLTGILAELLMRTYYESQGKQPYVVRAIYQWRLNEAKNHCRHDRRDAFSAAQSGRHQSPK